MTVCAARWWPYPPREYGKDGYPVSNRFVYGCALDPDMNATLGACELHGCGTRCRCPFLPETP
jgi:hypothetical protein